MKRVETRPLAEAPAGMLLHAAVLDDGGRVLVPAGAVLTEAMLSSLARRDIPSVTIEIEEAEDPAQREARRRHLDSELARRFRLAGDAPEVAIIRQAVLNVCLEQSL